MAAKIETSLTFKLDKHNHGYYIGSCGVPATLDLAEAIFLVFPFEEDGKKGATLVIQQLKTGSGGAGGESEGGVKQR